MPVGCMGQANGVTCPLVDPPSGHLMMARNPYFKVACNCQVYIMIGKVVNFCPFQVTCNAEMRFRQFGPDNLFRCFGYRLQTLIAVSLPERTFGLLTTGNAINLTGKC